MKNFIIFLFYIFTPVFSQTNDLGKVDISHSGLNQNGCIMFSINYGNSLIKTPTGIYYYNEGDRYNGWSYGIDLEILFNHKSNFGIQLSWNHIYDFAENSRYSSSCELLYLYFLYFFKSVDNRIRPYFGAGLFYIIPSITAGIEIDLTDNISWYIQYKTDIFHLDTFYNNYARTINSGFQFRF